jgi:hypothetical protein
VIRIRTIKPISKARHTEHTYSRRPQKTQTVLFRPSAQTSKNAKLIEQCSTRNNENDNLNSPFVTI